jgi:hypothetical protein
MQHEVYVDLQVHYITYHALQQASTATVLLGCMSIPSEADRSPSGPKLNCALCPSTDALFKCFECAPWLLREKYKQACKV